MSFLKKLGETMKDTASTIGAKSFDMMEIGKLKLQKNQLENSIKEKKTEIGDLIYKAHKQGDIQNSDSLKRLFVEIVELEKQISDIEVKLNREENSTPPQPDNSKENKENIVTDSEEAVHCPRCGEKLSKGVKFCGNCGSPQ